MAVPTRAHRGQVNEWDPQREFESMLGRFFGGTRGEGISAEYGAYPVDVREDADHLYIEAELPGFRKEDVNITFENQTLTISAERTEERSQGNGGQQGQQGHQGNNGGKKGELLLHERRFTRFLRSFTLPPTVSPERVDAKLQDGLLKITLDKKEETKPRRIEVS